MAITRAKFLELQKSLKDARGHLDDLDQKVNSMLEKDEPPAKKIKTESSGSGQREPLYMTGDMF